MWRCARCGARNTRQVAHCSQCGMPSPFEDGGQTKTIDIPEVEPEPARKQSSLPWIVIGVVALLLLALLVIAVVALSG